MVWPLFQSPFIDEETEIRVAQSPAGGHTVAPRFTDRQPDAPQF